VGQRGFGAPILLGRNSLLASRMAPGNTWWQNLHGARNPRALVDHMAGRLGVQHIVAGHVPGKVVYPDGKVRKGGEISHHFGDRLWLIDSRLSRPMGDTGKLLLVKPQLGRPDGVWSIDQKGHVDRIPVTGSTAGSSRSSR
jgi:hypothetical protein